MSGADAACIVAAINRVAKAIALTALADLADYNSKEKVAKRLVGLLAELEAMAEGRAA